MKLKILVLSLFAMGVQQLCAGPVDLGVIQTAADLVSPATKGMVAFFAELAKQKAMILSAPARQYRYGLERLFMIDVLTAQELFADLKPSSGRAATAIGAISGAVYVTPDDKGKLIAALKLYADFADLLSAVKYLEPITDLINANKQSLVAATTNKDRYTEYVKLNALVKELSQGWTFVSPQELAEQQLEAQKKILADLLAKVQARDVAELRLALGREKTALVAKLGLAIAGNAIVNVEQLHAQVEAFLVKVHTAQPVPKKPVVDKPVKKSPSAEQVAAQIAAQQKILIALRQQVVSVDVAALQDERSALIQEIAGGEFTLGAGKVIALRALQNKVAVFIKKALAEQRAALAALQKQVDVVVAGSLESGISRQKLLADIARALEAKDLIDVALLTTRVKDFLAKTAPEDDTYIPDQTSRPKMGGSRRPRPKKGATPVEAAVDPMILRQQLLMLAESLAALRSAL